MVVAPSRKIRICIYNAGQFLRPLPRVRDTNHIWYISLLRSSNNTFNVSAFDTKSAHILIGHGKVFRNSNAPYIYRRFDKSILFVPSVDSFNDCIAEQIMYFTKTIISKKDEISQSTACGQK